MGCVRSKQAIRNLLSFYFANKIVFRHKTVYFLKEILLVLIFHKHTAVTGIENKRHKMFT